MIHVLLRLHAAGGECDSRFTSVCKRQTASARLPDCCQMQTCKTATENTLGRNRAYASTRVERS
jgi:hypothetical protein